jgi:hypothetical protein
MHEGRVVAGIELLAKASFNTVFVNANIALGTISVKIIAGAMIALLTANAFLIIAIAVTLKAITAYQAFVVIVLTDTITTGFAHLRRY